MILFLTVALIFEQKAHTLDVDLILLLSYSSKTYNRQLVFKKQMNKY